MRKTYLITGATDGIGKYTAMGIASSGHQVIITGRNRDKGKDVIRKIKLNTGVSDAVFMQTDFLSFEKVRNLAMEIRERFPYLNGIVNNAAAYYRNFGISENGYERQIQVNYLSPVLLSRLLMDLLLQSTGSRIVNVSSESHRHGTIDYDRFTKNISRYSGMRAYAQSKLANILFTYELDRKFSNQGLIANCLHPGVYGTNIVRPTHAGWQAIFWHLYGLTKPHPKRGAETPIFLILDPKVKEVSGKYFIRQKPVSSSFLTYDENLAGELWEKTEKILDPFLPIE